VSIYLEERDMMNLSGLEDEIYVVIFKEFEGESEWI